MSPRHDYAAQLRARHAQAVEDAAGAKPAGLTEYRARCDRDAWRARWCATGGRDARDFFNVTDRRP